MRLRVGKLMLLAVLMEQRSRRVLRLLNVGLIEGVDIEEQACRRRGHFPAEELRAECAGVGYLESRMRYAFTSQSIESWCRDCSNGQRDDEAIVPQPYVGRFARDRHYPLSVLARALCDQLLHPETERLHLGRDPERQFVATGTRSCAHQCAESQTGILAGALVSTHLL